MGSDPSSAAVFGACVAEESIRAVSCIPCQASAGENSK